MNEKQINAIFERANNFVRLGNLPAAIADYTQVIAHLPDFAPAYFNRAFARQHGNADLPGALADYDRALALRPDFPEAYANRAIAHQQNGDLPAAIADYTAALRLQPQAAFYNNRGEALFLLGDFAAAAQDFEQALALLPDYRYAAAGLAVCLFALGQTEQARQHWAGLAARDPLFSDLEQLQAALGWAAPLVAMAKHLIGTP